MKPTKIEKVSNGFILTNEDPGVIIQNKKLVFTNIEDLLNYILFIYEGKHPSFDGDSYGMVSIVHN